MSRKLALSATESRTERPLHGISYSELILFSSLPCKTTEDVLFPAKRWNVEPRDPHSAPSP
jgi:hypothetical protein